MLLAEFVGRAHIQLDDDRQQAVDLHQVDSFVFSDTYLIKMKNGKSYDVRDLDVILSVMHDEFDLWRNQLRPELEINDNFGTKGVGFAKMRQLVIKGVQPGGFVPVPPVASVVDRVRLAVTMFNLTGSWDQFQQSNL